MYLVLFNISEKRSRQDVYPGILNYTTSTDFHKETMDEWTMDRNGSEWTGAYCSFYAILIHSGPFKVMSIYVYLYLLN